MEEVTNETIVQKPSAAPTASVEEKPALKTQQEDITVVQEDKPVSVVKPKTSHEEKSVTTQEQIVTVEQSDTPVDRTSGPDQATKSVLEEVTTTEEVTKEKQQPKGRVETTTTTVEEVTTETVLQQTPERPADEKPEKIVQEENKPQTLTEEEIKKTEDQINASRATNYRSNSET